MDWNYRVNLYEDYTIDEIIAYIAKEEINDSLNNSFTYQKNDKRNSTNENDTNFSTQVEDVTMFSNQNDFNDVTLACVDKQFKTHKQVISTSSLVLDFNSTEQNSIVALEMQEQMSEQVFTNISEELLKEICEEVSADVQNEIEECSQLLYENIAEELQNEIF